MPTKPSVASTTEAGPSAPPTKPKTFTNWKAFADAKLTPATISCQAYKPIHLADMSCHTRLLFHAATLKRHIEAEHGAGFQFLVKNTDGKPSPFWTELEELGLEAHDFRCDVCDEELRFNPTTILRHMRNHAGKTRKAGPGGMFNVTIGFSAPDRSEDDGEYAEPAA